MEKNVIKVAFVFNRQRNKSLDEAEFDTPEVIDAITTALKKVFEVVEIEMDRAGQWIRQLEMSNPDVVLNTAEGFRGIGRESLAPICFEQLGIHYAGPGPYQCFLTLDKFLTKQVVSAAGVNVAEGMLIQNLSELINIEKELVFPVFAKPNFEGSSKGIGEDSICRSISDLRKYLSKNLKEFSEGILVERFIDGTDVTVPFLSGLGDEGGLEPVEYYRADQRKNWIYDFNLKNVDDSDVMVRCPADFDQVVIDRIINQMKRVVQALAIVDMARADFRITPEGEVFFVEINALPSLQPGASMFEASSRLGFSYDDTIRHIVQSALQRKKTNPATKTPKKIRTSQPNVSLVFNVKRKKPDEEGYELESEFDSPETIEAIRKGIAGNGYKVNLIEMSRNLSEELISSKTDIVFNIAEGFNHRTREAQVPALCDLLGIEHTGSDATCLALTLDKCTTSRLIGSEGLKAPKSQVIHRTDEIKKLKLNYPIIAKPNFEGTSKGIYDNSVAEDPEELKKVVQNLASVLPSGVLCEEYIEGREFTVGLLGNANLKILGPSEVVFKDRGPGTPKRPVYSFEAKQEENALDNRYYRVECPADLTEAQLKSVRAFAKKIFRVLGCRDVARIDFRMTSSGGLYFIEINPLPGLSPGFSDLSILAEKSGLDYSDLIGMILRPSVQRWRKSRLMGLGA